MIFFIFQAANHARERWGHKGYFDSVLYNTLVLINRYVHHIDLFCFHAFRPLVFLSNPVTSHVITTSHVIMDMLLLLLCHMLLLYKCSLTVTYIG